jgi:hypothetical protein
MNRPGLWEERLVPQIHRGLSQEGSLWVRCRKIIPMLHRVCKVRKATSTTSSQFSMEDTYQTIAAPRRLHASIFSSPCGYNLSWAWNATKSIYIFLVYVRRDEALSVTTAAGTVSCSRVLRCTWACGIVESTALMARIAFKWNRWAYVQRLAACLLRAL